MTSKLITSTLAAVRAIDQAAGQGHLQRTARWATLAGRLTAVGLSVACAASPAFAQTLKQTGVNIFTVIYGIVGVVGAIMGLLTLLNWTTGNWLGREDPKRTFMQVLLSTALAFGIVAIIQFIKETVGSSSSGISNL
jgi:hypothetical protein